MKRVLLTYDLFASHTTMNYEVKKTCNWIQNTLVHTVAHRGARVPGQCQHWWFGGSYQFYGVIMLSKYTVLWIWTTSCLENKIQFVRNTRQCLWCKYDHGRQRQLCFLPNCSTNSKWRVFKQVQHHRKIHHEWQSQYKQWGDSNGQQNYYM